MGREEVAGLFRVHQRHCGFGRRKDMFDCVIRVRDGGMVMVMIWKDDRKLYNHSLSSRCAQD